MACSLSSGGFTGLFFTNNYGDSVVSHFCHVLPEELMEVIEQGSPDGHITPETLLEVTEPYLMAEMSAEATVQI